MDAIRERQQHIEDDRASYPQSTVKVNLPPADSWDTQTGHGQLVKLNVRAYYTPFNDEWFTLHLHLDFDGKDRPLTESALLVSRNPTHDLPSAAVLKTISLSKEVLGRHGAVLRSLEVRNPALMDPESNTIIHLEAWVAGRLGVALAINDGVISVTSVN